MCGIAGGIWNLKTSANAALTAALSFMRQRGPDDQGGLFHEYDGSVVGLGQTRLSIIDLSDGGHQPMQSPDGRWVLVFNGEIYNYRELRAELVALGYVFSSHSDTEVLLAAWAAWGKACLSRLIGMFAFAILDKQTGRLSCVRDPFGIKPFFYSFTASGFRFASEPRALISMMPAPPVLNWQRAYDYLVHADYDSSEDSFFDGVKHLMPGHCLEIDLEHMAVPVVNAWWTPSVCEVPGWTFERAVEQVRARFLDSVRLHLRSDVPLGAALSGGIDSSAVVCAMRYLAPTSSIHTFSFIASGSPLSEELWVDRVNAHVSAVAHKVEISPDELLEDIDDMIHAQGEPFGSTSIYAQYRVFKAARHAGITVTLDGQGADEMLGGYVGYPGQRLRSLWESQEFSKFFRFFDAWSAWPARTRGQSLRSFLGQYLKEGRSDFLRQRFDPRMKPAWLNTQALDEHGVVCRYPFQVPDVTERGRRLVAELACSLSKRGLPALLRHADRNSMRFSVESRVPFLNKELVEMMLSLPEDYLVSLAGETKHVFRAAMRGIVPDDVLDRKDKIGFATPEQAWLFANALQIRRWLEVDLDLPFWKRDKVLAEFDLIVAKQKPFSWQVWRWVNFSRWYALYFLKAPSGVGA